MSPTSTESMKSHLGEAGTQARQAAQDTGETLRSAAAAAGEELKQGKDRVQADLADGAQAGRAAAGEAAAAAHEQMDALMEKSRDLIDSAAGLVRERPLASFGVAFAAGFILAKLAGKK